MWNNKVTTVAVFQTQNFTSARVDTLLFLFSPGSSDVVWELKKKNRWKTMSTKDAEILENRYKEYTESAPMDNSIVDLENGFQVIV